MASQKVTPNSTFATVQDTFTTVNTGVIMDSSSCPFKNFSLSVKMTGSQAYWTVALEGSNDGINFSPILMHKSSSSIDGSTIFTGQSLSPCLYFRSNCMLLGLTVAKNIITTILGTV